MENNQSKFKQIVNNARESNHNKTDLEGSGVELELLLVQAPVATSKREALQFLERGNITVNARIAKLGQRLTTSDLLDGDVVIVCRGKSNFHVLNFI